MSAGDAAEGQRLLDAYLDGELTAAEAPAFHAWLRADPANLRALARAAHLDAALVALGGVQPAAMEAGTEPPMQPLPPPTRPGSVPGPRSASRPWVRRAAPVALAGLLLAVAMAVVAASHNAVPDTAAATSAWTADQGGAVAPGSLIETTTGTPRTLTAADGTRLTVAGASAVRLPDGGRHLDLLRGSLNAEVAPQAPEAPLLILTPQSALVVLGTAFRLTVDDGGTTLAMAHGRVRCIGLVDGAVREARDQDELRAPPAAPPDPTLEIRGLTLVDADRGTVLLVLRDGQRIDLAALPAGVRLNLRAELGPRRPGSVRFSVVDGRDRPDPGQGIDRTRRGNVNLERNAPFQLVYDDSGPHRADWAPEPGSFLIVATPFAKRGAQGAAGMPYVIGCTTVGARATASSSPLSEPRSTP